MRRIVRSFPWAVALLLALASPLDGQTCSLSKVAAWTNQSTGYTVLRNGDSIAHTSTQAQALSAARKQWLISHDTVEYWPSMRGRIIGCPVVTPPPTYRYTLASGACSCDVDTTARLGSASINVTGDAEAWQVQWNAVSAKPWLTLTASSGRGNGFIPWAIDPAGLTTGTYRDSIRVTSPSAAPLVIVVTLRVGAVAPPVVPPPPPPIVPPPPPGPPPPPPPIVPSPPPVVVGPPAAGHPMFVVNATRRVTWARMKAEAHPWYTYAARGCALTGTSGELYGDDGMWCGLLAVYEHDSTAARKAATALLRGGLYPQNANDMREAAGARIVIADWIWSLISQPTRDSIFTQLNGWNRYGVKGTGPMYVGGFRTGDGDAATAYYLAIAMFDRFTRSTRWLDSTVTVPGLAVMPVGNLGATNLAGSARQWLEGYWGMCAAGGQWSEGTEYNPGTMALALLGYEAIKTADGVDSLPTLRRCFDQAAIRVAWEWTPDLLQISQWGDNQDPRDPVLHRQIGFLGLLQGVTRHPVVGGLLKRLVARHGVAADPAISGGRAVGVVDVYAPIDSTPRQGAWVAPGRGQLWVQGNGCLFFGEAQPHTGEDHDVSYIHNHALYCDGEQVVNHPIGYGNPFLQAEGVNGVSYAGHGAAATRTFSGVDSAGGRYCITGSTSGALGVSAGWDAPPPPNLTLGRRTTCYRQVSGTAVVVTKDSVTAISEWFAVFHPQTLPTPTGNTWTWRTPSGRAVTLTTYSDGVISADPVLDERTLWASVHQIAMNPTLGQQLRLRTTGRTLVTVTQVGTALPVARTATGVTVGGVAIGIP